ncbi:MAG TPA: TonB family protein, partial [Gemmatimonadales bacterium]
ANQMVVGNYIESGRNFRLSLALYDTHDVTRLWTDEVTGSTDSLFSLLDRMANRMAAALCTQPSYNPGNICFDTPAKERAPLVIAVAHPDSGGPLSLLARVSSGGEVSDVRIAANTGAGERVTRALTLLRDARFEPARRGGRPVAAWANVRVGLSGASVEEAVAPARVCANPATAVKNPGQACYDARPVPQSAPLAPSPSSCGLGGQTVNVLVQVGIGGRVIGDPTVARESGCEAFDQSAIDVAQNMTFAPATKGGHPVIAWIVLQMRPASAAGGHE